MYANKETIKSFADLKCKKCYGRGYLSTKETEEGVSMQLCRCATMAMAKKFEEERAKFMADNSQIPTKEAIKEAIN